MNFNLNCDCEKLDQYSNVNAKQNCKPAENVKTFKYLGDKTK